MDAKITAQSDSVRTYRERLAVLQGVWDNLSLLSQMNGDGTNMQTTRSAFEQLAGDLLQNLGTESLKKTVLAMQGKTQVAIDVLIRNLFERTADIGFLCTDQAIQQYLHRRRETSTHENQVSLAKLHEQLRRRFGEYVAKYSVYDNIVLLAPDGEVLLQLTGEPLITHSKDALVKETLTTSQGYVETFRHVDLFAQPDSLVYSYRVTVGHNVLGILCLSFRFKDETDGIFTKLLNARDWMVLTYLDAQGQVIASSDAWQIPVGAHFESASDAEGNVLRFAGREYLAVTRTAKPYQGYRGPGWRCHALVPLEKACASEISSAAVVSKDALTAVRKNNAVFSPELQRVPLQADEIQRELNRAVWNGHIRIGNRGETNNSFSKVLLWEISHTGRKTQEVFEHSIAELERTVVSSILQDSVSMALLAVDILDRNLYERANDCRWWALDRTLCRYLEKPSADIASVTAVLQQINHLYTVYRTLVLFDTQGCVLAVSNPQYESCIGYAIADSWAQATLALNDSQRYHVSPFEPSVFYDNQPTLIYSAALRAQGRTVGGIGIVFDTAPQLHAMLSDALGRDDGSIAIFATADGRVLSATAHYQPGDKLAFEAELLTPPSEGHVRVVTLDDTYYAVGVKATSGYREYPGLNALALVLLPLGTMNHAAAQTQTTQPHLPARRTQNNQHKLELATFRVGCHWLAVPLEQIIEAVPATGLHTLPEKTRGQAGYILHAGVALTVANLDALLETGAVASKDHSHREIVLVRTTDGKSLGLLVDVLGEIPQVNTNDVIPCINMFASDSLTESMVRSEQADDPLLLILSPERVAAALDNAAGALRQTAAANSGA